MPHLPFAPPVSRPTPLRQKITAATLRDEAECILPLAAAATMPAALQEPVRDTARRLVEAIRAKDKGTSVDGLVKEYALSSQEGVALMCLAEALLRIPDPETRDALIRDKIAPGDWAAHLGRDRPVFINAATWGLLLTGRLVQPADDRTLASALSRMIARLGEPVIRRGVDFAMRMLGEQFVLGETIGEALERSRPQENRGYAYSYDMLGEAATTAADAQSYFDAYARAIEAIGTAARGTAVHEQPGISIKLSALHPRYSRPQADRVMAELLPRAAELCQLAKSHNIGLNVDAEEAERLELSLDIFEALALDPALAGWDGLGFVAQAYSKRCPFVLDWLIDLAARSRRRIMVRLVKGAYWDAEIKRAQLEGLSGFPVYTRKVHTDIAYLACASKLLGARDRVFPQFATHNAQSVAAIHHLAGPHFTPGDYEFQCLHGMGQPLHDEVVDPHGLNRPSRIYAPVGTHDTLLAYLVRRLLENGANSSFVNRIADPAVPVEELAQDPVAKLAASPQPGSPHPGIALPRDLFPGRINSAGLDITDERVLQDLSEVFAAARGVDWAANLPRFSGERRIVRNPGDHADVLGTIQDAIAREVEQALARAAASAWPLVPVEERAARLEGAADRLEEQMASLLPLIMREAGKTLPNAVAEVREAVDFLRYYAAEGRRRLAGSRPLGPVACISPWNFPLAIFTGQVAAALMAGNPVLAKPAEETPLIAAQAVRILHEAGIPADALQWLPGAGEVGAALVGSPLTCGVLFTGSTEVARLIQRQLAARTLPGGKPIPLVAETGGQNAMIVDSSALPEQVVRDVLASAFDSAGQRCSALRVLCLQDDIAEPMLEMLQGAMAELRVGPTDKIAVDVGPVISAEARDGIEAYLEDMAAQGHRVYRVPLGPETDGGTFVAPALISLDAVGQLGREVFGPVLHVLRYRREELDDLVAAVNNTGYGLTFGLHTRLDSTTARVLDRIGAGNRYVNRNTIGAVVGVQPFGGNGLSGTGPKAGGPLYLTRLAHNVSGPLRAARASVDPGLLALAEGLERQGQSALSAMAREYGAISPVGLERELPGPVGERNFYALEPRGAVLCHATNEAGLIQQIAAVLATGNEAHVEGRDVPAGLPPEVLARLQLPAQTAFAAALFEGDEPALLAFQQRVARLEGAIVPLQSASREQCAAGLAYRTDWLCEEVSTSINTAAAGGNASLMTIAE